MRKQEVADLLKKYNQGNCTEAEKAIVEDWYLQYEDENLQELSSANREHDLEKIWAALPVHQSTNHVIHIWRKIAVAASVLIFLGAALLLMRQHKTTGTLLVKGDVAPGANKAILKLGSGKSIILSDAATGKIVNTLNLNVNNSKAGVLQYLDKALTSDNAQVYDTLYTPLGGTFKLKLADGSIVQLNAASALRYPETFNGKERIVELLKGEGYFEVAHNNAKPFKVITGRQVTEDVGTSFNINAYGDNVDVQTTLIEGAVKIIGGGKNARMLKPGQQANFTGYGDSFTVRTVETDDVTAWKDGLFLFDNTTLANVMKQLARWYNVKVTYAANISSQSFTGGARRSANLSAVLKMLQTTGNLKFEIKNRNIIVENKYSPR